MQMFNMVEDFCNIHDFQYTSSEFLNFQVLVKNKIGKKLQLETTG